MISRSPPSRLSLDNPGSSSHFQLLGRMWGHIRAITSHLLGLEAGGPTESEFSSQIKLQSCKYKKKGGITSRCAGACVYFFIHEYFFLQNVLVALFIFHSESLLSDVKLFN